MTSVKSPGQWKRHPSSPLLSLRPGRFDSNHIHAPMVVREGGRYRMWYSGSDRDGNELHRIGYAESKDGVSWERLEEPVLSPSDPEGYFSVPAVLRDAGGEVLRQDGRLMMWITGHNLMCDLRLCTSEDGIEWTGDPEADQHRGLQPHRRLRGRSVQDVVHVPHRRRRHGNLLRH